MKTKTYFINSVLIAFGIIVLSSCQSKLDKASYFNYFNGFQEGSYQEIVNGAYTYQLQYRPSSFLALNELRSEEDINKKEFSKLKKDYSDQHLFCLRIIGDGKTDVLKQNITEEAQYYSRLEKLNTQIPFLIQSVSDKDTSQPIFHHFERSYQLRPFVQILFALNGKEKISNINEITFSDEIFQGSSKIKFDQIQSLNKNQPKLSL